MQGAAITPLSTPSGEKEKKELKELKELRKLASTQVDQIGNLKDQINNLKMELALALEKCRGFDLHREIVRDNMLIQELQAGIAQKANEAQKIEVQIIKAREANQFSAPPGARGTIPQNSP